MQRLLAADVITGGRDSHTDAAGQATSQKLIPKIHQTGQLVAGSVGANGPRCVSRASICRLASSFGGSVTSAWLDFLCLVDLFGALAFSCSRPVTVLMLTPRLFFPLFSPSFYPSLFFFLYVQSVSPEVM